MWTPEQIEKAAKYALAGMSESIRLEAEVTAEIGQGSWKRLLDSPEVERACQAIERGSKAKKDDTPTPEQLQAAKKYLEMEIELGMDHPSLSPFWKAMGAKFGLETWTAAVNYSLTHPDKKPSPPRPTDDEPSDGIPELLPVKALPGYLVDAWGVPHRVKSAGRKAGKVKPDNYLFRKKGEKAVRHMARYRLTVEGKQRAFYPRYLLRARIHAEQEWIRSEVSPTDNEVSLSQEGLTCLEVSL